MCLLWLWALWQFVQLELSGSCLVVDFFSWRREILTVKDKETKRETECKGGRAVRLWQPLIPPTRSAHTLITNTPFPFLSLLLYCNLRTHTCFYWLHHASWPLLVKEKNFSPCCHTVVLPWVHTSLQKTGWLSDCCSIFLSVLSTRLHAWLLLRLSVCRSARNYHSMCVITVCQLAYNARMSANLSACPPLCLCAKPTFTSFPGCLSCILPSCWRMISGSYSMKTWGRLSVAGHACRWQHKQKRGTKTQCSIFQLSIRDEARWTCFSQLNSALF